MVIDIITHIGAKTVNERLDNTFKFFFLHLSTVCIDGRCFNLYDVVSSKAKNDLAQIAHELKEKDMVNMEKREIFNQKLLKFLNKSCLMIFSIDQALVIPLEDSGFLILLHSSHLFSYEGKTLPSGVQLQFQSN